MGCGEGTSLHLMLAATGFVYGADQVGIVASTGCNSVFGSTYPFNPFKVPWTNSGLRTRPRTPWASGCSGTRKAMRSGACGSYAAMVRSTKSASNRFRGY